MIVSIIIPTFNRAHLIGETLDSILCQTYQSWECIVVDDGSTDCTAELLKFYAQKDPRIQFHQRPKNKIKGANSCRNIGFEKSSGEFIIWFDSDDLMTPNHVEAKVEALRGGKFDFVVSQTANFDNDKLLEPYKYEKKHYGIKASDFILLKIHWYTYDVMLVREIAENIRWNEQMKSWQDYNYFCKMLIQTEKGEFLDEVLTYRRLHDHSIQDSLNRSRDHFCKELLENRIYTYWDIYGQIDKGTQTELIFGMMNLCHEIARMNMSSMGFGVVNKIVKRELGGKAKIYFNLALLTGRMTGKGYFFLKKAKDRLLLF